MDSSSGYAQFCFHGSDSSGKNVSLESTKYWELMMGAELREYNQFLQQRFSKAAGNLGPQLHYLVTAKGKSKSINPLLPGQYVAVVD